MSTVDKWSGLEKIAEGTKLSCALSQHPYLLNFMQHIFVRLTRLLYGAFCIFPKTANSLQDVHKEAISLIASKFKPMYDREYLLRPGLDNITDDEIVNMLETIIGGGCDTKFMKRFSLNQLMGAIYGVSTDRMIVGKILMASCFREFRSAFDSVSANVHAKSIHSIIDTIQSIFGIPKAFSTNSMLRSIGYPSADNQLVTMLLDMMVYKMHGTSMSIVRRNLNNLPYIRVRSDKQQTEYTKYSNIPFCPTFHKKTKKDIKLVHGNSWYYVPNDSIMRKYMKMFGRTVKAGISGSTLMWMNLVFHVIGVEETRENLEMLLLCIISDFVPKYHSLSEILLVYCKESKFARQHPYYINEPSIRWLIYELEKNRNVKIDSGNLFSSLHDFLDKVYFANNQLIRDTKCPSMNIKIRKPFVPITRKRWDEIISRNTLKTELKSLENLRSPLPIISINKSSTKPSNKPPST